MSKTPETDAALKVTQDYSRRYEIDEMVKEEMREFGTCSNGVAAYLLRHARSLETQRNELREALREVLEQIDSLDGYQLTRDVEQYKAQAVWDDTIENARAALQPKEDK